MWTPAEVAAVAAAIFAGLNTLIAALSAVLIVYFNGRRSDQTRDLGKAIDGRMTELLVEKGLASSAVGEAKGRADLHAEIKAEDNTKK